jgi:hypothetical protein
MGQDVLIELHELNMIYYLRFQWQMDRVQWRGLL